MRVQGQRIAVLVLALAVTAGILFGLQHWLFLTQTRDPLQAQLQKMQSVRRVTLDLTGTSPSVKIVLGRVKDIETTYQAIEAKVRAHSPGASLVVTGDANKDLLTQSQVFSFPIEQGIATGEFMTMRQGVMQAAAKLHLTASVYVDAQNVYLALYEGGRSAYFIYPRGGK